MCELRFCDIYIRSTLDFTFVYNLVIFYVYQKQHRQIQRQRRVTFLLSSDLQWAQSVVSLIWLPEMTYQICAN